MVLLDRQDLPSAGGGETPIIGIAPAVGNAVYDAVGIRLRDFRCACRPEHAAASRQRPGIGVVRRGV